MVQYKMLYALLCSSGVMPREKNLLTWEQSKAWHTLINCASQQQHRFVPNAAYDLQPSLRPSARPWPTVEHSPGAVAFSFLFYTLIYFSIRKISTLQMKRQQYIKIYTRISEGKKNPNYVFNFLESVVSTFAFHRQGNYKENEQLNMESVITYSIKTIKMPPSIWKVLGSISGTPPNTHPNTDPSSTTQHGKQLNQGMAIWFCQAMFLDTNINTARIPSILTLRDWWLRVPLFWQCLDFPILAIPTVEVPCVLNPCQSHRSPCFPSSPY